MRKLLSMFFGIGLLLQINVVFAAQATDSFEAPQDFKLIRHETGVSIYQRNKDYIQVIDPKQGASVHSLVGKTVEWRAYLTLERKSAQEWWQQATSILKKPVSLTNGEFFDTSESDQAALAFSVKAEGEMVGGYADETEFRGKKLIFATNGQKSSITKFNDDPASIVARPEDTVIVGLDPSTDKFPNRRLARTFLAVDGSGRILIYSSPQTTQRFATRMLLHFGVHDGNVMMLDGGGSSFLVLKGNVVLPTAKIKGGEPITRRLPHVLAVEAGTPVKVEASK